jgi:hypothetical protein
MVYWFPGMTIASLRFHHVNPRDVCKKRMDDDAELGVRELWCWVSPEATARACLICIEGDHFKGHEGEQVPLLTSYKVLIRFEPTTSAFNIVAPTIVWEDVSSAELAKKYYPETKLKNMEGNASFWSTEKAKRILGWDHPEIA